VIELEINWSHKHWTLTHWIQNSIPQVAIPAFRRSCIANSRSFVAHAWNGRPSPVQRRQQRQHLHCREGKTMEKTFSQ
jgi:hypothetical protein